MPFGSKAPRDFAVKGPRRILPASVAEKPLLIGRCRKGRGRARVKPQQNRDLQCARDRGTLLQRRSAR